MAEKLDRFRRMSGGPNPNKRLEVIEKATEEILEDLETSSDDLDTLSTTVTALSSTVTTQGTSITSLNARVTILEAAPSTSPGGSSGLLQYNNAGNFGGVTAISYSGSTITFNSGSTFTANANFGFSDSFGITFGSSSNAILNQSGNNDIKYQADVALSPVGRHVFTGSSNYTHTSGDREVVNISGTYQPTSGTGSINCLEITPTINQAAGGTGVNYGIYINPTLTSAKWEAIHIGSGPIGLAAGTTTYASLKFPAGSAKTSPVDGDMWRIGATLYLRDGSTTKSITFT